jgi:hypothetical protein
MRDRSGVVAALYNGVVRNSISTVDFNTIYSTYFSVDKDTQVHSRTQIVPYRSILNDLFALVRIESSRDGSLHRSHRLLIYFRYTRKNRVLSVRRYANNFVMLCGKGPTLHEN